MRDGFDSLRLLDAADSPAVDPTFRTDLLTEARRRLLSNVSETTLERIAAPPVATSGDLEDGHADRSHRAQRVLLIAACLVLALAGIVGLAVSQSEDPAVTETTPPATTFPATTVPPTTVSSGSTVPPTTTPSVAPGITTQTLPTSVAGDSERADLMLVTKEDFGPGWTDAVEANRHRPRSFNPDGSNCDTYERDVFEEMRTAVIAERVFTPPPPMLPDELRHRVLIYADDTTASRVFKTLNEPTFMACTRGRHPFDIYRWEPTPVTPPFEIEADELIFYRFTKNVAPASVMPEYAAVMLRIDRVIVFLETVQVDTNGDPTMTDDQFAKLAELAATAARHALELPAD
jgi:hypothetical protein